MLQPRNWAQTKRPNLYNVNYGRVGTYKGMGGLGQDNIDPAMAAALTRDEQIKAAAAQKAWETGGTVVDPGYVQLPSGQVIGPVMPSTMTQYLPWIIGGGVLLMMLAAGRRR